MAKNFMSNEDATSVLTGYANAIKSKQKKTLSSPITVDGVSCTTVESCLRAIKEVVDPTPTVLTLGETYTFGNNGENDIEWTCIESYDNYYVLQSHGITGGMWPGYTMSKWGNGSNYRQNISGQDMSEYDTRTLTLYNSIKDAEKLDASYGDGLFLIGTDKTGIDAYSSATSQQKVYRDALLLAAPNSSVYSVGKSCFLGDYVKVGNYDCAYFINCIEPNDGNIVGGNQYNPYIIAPCFNLDPSKVRVDANNVITLK